MEFELHQTVWIPLPDGTRLCAAIWMPVGPGPFPAVLEYLPYRRGDGTAPRDDVTYPAYARAGIVGVRVDSRGQGDSEGFFDDEYSPTELADAEAVIAWIADQPWSNGAVGMMGISWGGFNSLQVAARRPEALGAVISIASTADRFNDDIHYKGGALLSAHVSWAGTMLSYNSRPPDPEVVGNRWAEIWRDRLEAQPMLLETWLKHQRRDAYWAHGSICEDWSAIRCPVWVLAGWADGYRNTPANLAAHLEAPVKATTGPWVHKYPHIAWPEPRLDFVAQSIDWWHQWLSGEPRGVEDWPHHMAYRVEAAKPGPWRPRDAGAWLAVPRDAVVETRMLELGDGVLGAPAGGPVRIATPQHCGTAGGIYFTTAPDGQLPGDQRADDALSACWEMPVTADLDLLGRAILRADVTLDQPQGHLIARLVDVHPDGTAALIARGVLNLSHRNGNAEPVSMTPGQAEAVEVVLDEACYRVRAGHRLRLALSTAYWPLVIPPPVAVTAEIAPGATLGLPLAPPGLEIAVAELDESTPRTGHPRLSEGTAHRRVEHDLNAGRVRFIMHEDDGETEVPRNAMRTRESVTETWEIAPDDPLSCTGHLTLTAMRARETWQTRTEAVLSFATTAEHFAVEARVTAWIDEEVFHTKEWAFKVPRDHM